MRYRDIEYTVVQGIKRGVWKWSTSIAGTLVSGKEPSKAAAVVTVEKTIDRALNSKTVRLAQPRAPRRPRKVSERSGAIPPTKAETGGTPTVRNYRSAASTCCIWREFRSDRCATRSPCRHNGLFAFVVTSFFPRTACGSLEA
jgi:hypothetical protein